MLATEYAQYYKIAAQAEGESDDAFKRRVAAELRRMNNLIEAHEALQDKRYDAEDGGDVMTGIIGAVAQKMQGDPYHNDSNPDRALGDDLAAGLFVQSADDRRQQGETALLFAMLFGALK